MHCQVPGIDYSLSKLAIHAALESATAIALSHTGILYIAETDEKKINRVRQVQDGKKTPLIFCYSAILFMTTGIRSTAGQAMWVFFKIS